MRYNYRKDKDAVDTDETEMRALIGLLCMAGLYRMSHTNIEDLYDYKDGTGIEFFRLVMSQSRLRFLLRAIRLDNVNTREERRKYDRLAAVRHIFEKFVANCRRN